MIAAGLELAIVQPTGSPEAVGIWNLATGLAVYLIGDTLYRRVLRIETGRLRLLVAALAFVTVLPGILFGALAQIAACVVLLQPLWLLERKQEEPLEIADQSGNMQRPAN